jgi:F-type H+-transporting ATPase subunit delta
MAEMSVIAHPYAQALFNLAKEQKDEQMWLEVLTDLEEIVANKEFSDLLNNPKIDHAQIIDLIKSLLNKRAYIDVLNFVQLLVENNRILAIAEIHRIFHQLILDDQKRGDAIIESAYAMSKEELVDFEQLLSKRFGKKITATVELNPKLIAGVKVTINDKVIDGSVSGRLESLATQLNK